MNGRTLMMLVVAVGCGLAAMVGAQRLLNRKGQAEPMREILVAARDLQVEQVLTADAVQAKKVPATAAPAGSFSSFKDVDRRWVKIPLLAGEPLVEAKLAPRDMPTGIVPLIPAGKRAFSLEVNEEVGVAGFILPNHHVDVVLARNGRNGARNKGSESETILQDVPVLASGQATTRPDDKTIQVRTVTLALSPEEVEQVVAARSEGELSLALRGFEDHTRIEPRPEPEPEAPAPAPAPPPEVVAAVVPPPPPPPPPAPVAPPVVAQPAPVAPPAAVVPTAPRRAIVVFRGLAVTSDRPNPERVLVGPGGDAPAPAPAPDAPGDPAPAEAAATAAAAGSPAPLAFAGVPAP
jgi:pilus assembly protein CpaB